MRQPGTRESRSQQKGTILLTTLALLSFLLIFTAVGTGLVQQQSQRGAAYDQALTAEYVSRAGLQLSLEQLFLDDNWASASMPEIVILDVTPDSRMQAKLTVYNNFGGSSTISAGGKDLQPGFVHIESTAIIDGQEARGNFGTASSFLARPDVVMSHALYDNDHGVGHRFGDAWIDGYDSDIEEVRDVYRWETGQPDQPSTVPPYDGRGGASIRSNGEIGSPLTIYGDIHLPTSSDYRPQGTGLVLGNIVRNDDPQIPLVFKTPPHLAQAPITPLNLSFPLTPGSYGDVVIPNGTRVVMERGEYSFGNLTIGEGCEFILQDDPTPPYEPVIWYVAAELIAERDCLFNMEPEMPSARQAQAAEFQLYGTDGPGRANTYVELKDGSRFRGVMAGYALKIEHQNGTFTGAGPLTLPGSAPSGRQGVDFFGGLYGQSLGHKPGIRYHYDIALGRKVLEGKAHWVLLDLGNLKRALH